MIATFMPKPFTHLTGNGCHFHMSLWDGDTNLFLDESDPRGLGLSGIAYRFIGGLKTHARAYSARHRADGQLVQAAEAGLDDERRDVVAGLDLVRLQQPDADAPHPRPGPDRGPHDRRLVQSRIWPRLRCSPRVSTASRTELDAGEPNSENLYTVDRRGAPRARARVAPGEPPRGDRRARAPTTCCARRSAGAATRTTSTTSPREARRVVPLPRAGHAWEIREYLTRF